MPNEHQKDGMPVQLRDGKQVSGCQLVDRLTTCSVGSDSPTRPSEREIAAAAAARGRLNGKVLSMSALSSGDRPFSRLIV